MLQVYRSHIFDDERQSWLQQMDERPIDIAHPFTGYKVHGKNFHTRTTSMNKKTYSCGVVVKGIVAGDGSVVDYYGVLEEVLQVEYPREPIK